MFTLQIHEFAAINGSSCILGTDLLHIQNLLMTGKLNMKLIRLLCAVSFLISLMAMILYFFYLGHLNNDDLSVVDKLFWYQDFPVYMILIQFATGILSLVYAIKLNNKKAYILLTLLIFIFIVFDLFFNNTTQKFNPL